MQFTIDIVLTRSSFFFLFSLFYIYIYKTTVIFGTGYPANSDVPSGCFQKLREGDLPSARLSPKFNDNLVGGDCNVNQQCICKAVDTTTPPPSPSTSSSFVPSPSSTVSLSTTTPSPSTTPSSISRTTSTSTSTPSPSVTVDPSNGAITGPTIPTNGPDDADDTKNDGNHKIIIEPRLLSIEIVQHDTKRARTLITVEGDEQLILTGRKPSSSSNSLSFYNFVYGTVVEIEKKFVTPILSDNGQSMRITLPSLDLYATDGVYLQLKISIPIPMNGTKEEYNCLGTMEKRDGKKYCTSMCGGGQEGYEKKEQENNGCRKFFEKMFQTCWLLIFLNHDY